jgi:hypothetical protein
MEINGRRFGWAFCKTSPLPHDLTEVYSVVHFDQLPLEELTPDWLQATLKLADRPKQLEMDAENYLVIDALGRLSRIESLVRIDPIGNLIHLDGTIEGNQLDWQVKSGTFLYKDDMYLPSNALLADSLSPQTHLPGLRSGQTWTVPAYSPFRPPNNPIEILQATVEGSEPMSYNGKVENVWVVAYRRDRGSGLGQESTPRERLWVRRDGTVVRQEAHLLDATMTFTRLPDDQAVELENQAMLAKQSRLGRRQEP